MKITQSNVRSVVLQALLLIFLAVLRAKADDSQLTKRDYFHNLPTLDPIPAQTVSTTFGDNNGKDSTTTTITATKSKKSTTTTATTITSFTALASIANDPETSTTTSSSLILTNTPLTNTTNQYTNTSDPLVQYDLECRADVLFCNKVSEAVGAAIDEFTRVINVKNSLL
jgi:hypothetical protein